MDWDSPFAPVFRLFAAEGLPLRIFQTTSPPLHLSTFAALRDLRDLRDLAVNSSTQETTKSKKPTEDRRSLATIETFLHFFRAYPSI